MRFGRKGYILMEVILAAGIFFIAVAGMAGAMGQMVEGLTEARRERFLQNLLESKYAELRVNPLEPGEHTIETDDPAVSFRAVLEEVEILNRDGIALDNVYLLTLRAVWNPPGGGDALEREMSLYVYQP